MTTKRGDDMVDQDVRDLAAKTAAELRRRGRRTKLFFDRDAVGDPVLMDTCTVCLVGAIAAARFGTPRGAISALYDPLAIGLIGEITDRLDLPNANEKAVYDWNDADTTTDADVLNLLDSIAAGE